jgi:anti-anti-sigma regulatory factor
MLNQMQTIVVRHVARLDAVIVTLRGETYGSLEVVKLEQLRADLAAVQTPLASERGRVIVDLSGLSMIGSAFLRELYTWIGKLGCDPANVIVSGVRARLLKLCATDRWLTVRPDLVAALGLLRPTTSGELTSELCPF